MSPTILYLIALALAGIGQIQSRGRDLPTWAIVFVCLGLLWGVFKL